jgi:hypothetical protein
MLNRERGKMKRTIDLIELRYIVALYCTIFNKDLNKNIKYLIVARVLYYSINSITAAGNLTGHNNEMP